ncbi:MAG: FG-GAP-like repeat-containing protein [Bacteroidota bacterium]
MSIVHFLFLPLSSYQKPSLFLVLSSILSWGYAQSFQDVSPIPIMPLAYDVRHGSMAAGDYNNDGKMDLYISGIDAFGQHVAFICQNNFGLFIPDSLASSQLTPLSHGSAEWGDYDNDGFLDLLACGEDSLGNLHTFVYHNDGAGGFQSIQQNQYPNFGARYGEVHWGDMDNDGNAEFLISGQANIFVNGQASLQAWTAIYSHFNNGLFIQQVYLPVHGIEQGSSSWMDINQDNYLDILQCGIDTAGIRQYVFHRTIFPPNAGSPYEFLSSTASYPAVSNSSLAWTDYDEDGKIDLLVSGIQSAGTHLSSIYSVAGFDSMGSPFYTQHSIPVSQVAGGSVLWGDYTSDGLVDLFVSGKPTNGQSEAEVLLGSGMGNMPFIEDSLSSTILQGTDSGQVAWIDFTNDGRLDLISIGNPPGGSGINFRMYQNIHNGPPLSHPAPINLSSISDTFNQMILSWDGPQTQGTKTYNVYIGTSPHLADVLHPMADLSAGKRRIHRHGNAGLNESMVISILDQGKYYWGVQTIGADYQGSVFSVQDSFYYTASQKVYPGDTNDDQLVDMWDLLPIGIKYNMAGPSRPIPGTDWSGQAAIDWADSLANGVNTKHVDADGNGLIDMNDVLLVDNHYGLVQQGNKGRVQGGVPLFLTGMPSFMNPGDSVFLDLHLGTADTLALDHYGLALTITYDSSLVDPGSVHVQVDSSWLGTVGTDLLVLYKDQFTSGKLDIGLVRNDQVDKSGYGKIASIIIVMDDDISKREIPFVLEFENILAIDATENQLDVSGHTASSFVDAEPNAIDQALDKGLSVFPNPISLSQQSFLEIRSEFVQITDLSLFTLQAFQIPLQHLQNQGSRISLPIQGLAPGIYFLRVQSESGISTRKICLTP